MDWFDEGKKWLNEGKKWLGTAGDMNSASNNPEEKVGWMDQQQKKIDQQPKTVQVQPALPKIPRTGNAHGQNPEPATQTLEPDKNEPLTDWTGHPVSEEERQRILAQKTKARANNSDDVNDMLDRLKQLRENRNVPNQKAFRFDSDISDNNEPRPESSAFEQGAETSVPQDESMAPAYKSFGESVMKALGFDSAVSGHGRAPAGEQDQSYSPLLRLLGKNISDNLGNNSAVSGYGRAPVGSSDMSYKSATDAAAKNIEDNLGDKSAVSGYGLTPAGTPDMSYKPVTDAITDSISHDFGLDSDVTGKGRQVIGAPNLSYWQNWGDEESRNMPFDMASDGAKQAWKDAEIMLYSGAALAGEHVYNLVGGDDTSIKRVQGILDYHQEELKNMKRMTTDDIYIDGDPERTMQNLTRYVYQELGNQTIKLPIYYVAAHLDTFATLFGVSSSVLSAQLYGDFREKTGDGHPVESIMYGVPLGLMSAALLPFRDKIPFQSAKEMKDYVQSFVVGAAVHRAQQDGKRKIVDMYGKKPQQDL